jgi:hypothetical protein
MVVEAIEAADLQSLSQLSEEKELADKELLILTNQPVSLTHRPGSSGRGQLIPDPLDLSRTP